MTFIEIIDGFLPWIFDKISNPFLDAVMVFLTKLGDGGILWICLIIAMLASKKYRRLGIVCAISLTICFFTGNYILKPLVARVRPCNLNSELPLLIPRLYDFSFPSMHTATAFSVSAVVFSEYKKCGTWMLFLSFFIGLSRVYLNVHYTTDILFGALYGVLVAYLVKLLLKNAKFSSKGY
ncbi:MAG: phosphatase PAP2 family protein [Oscillospiraceae bacterium]|nr:phosphatase PAP2 family protein [Oscillospiraceae bacterium]